MNEWLASTLRLLRSNVEAAPLAPRVRVELDRPIPAWAVKAAAALIASVCILVLAAGWLVVVITAGLGAVIMIGRSAAPAALTAVLVAFLVLTGEPFASPIFVLVFGIHLLAALFALVADLPFSALIELRVITERIPRFLVIQLFAQLVVAAAAFLNGTQFTARSLAIGAAVALAGISWAGLVRLSRLGST